MNEQTRPPNAAPQDNSEADLANMDSKLAAKMRHCRESHIKVLAKAEAKAQASAVTWDTLSARLREQIGEGDFTRWFKDAKPTVAGTAEGVVLRLALPTRFARDWVDAKYGVYICTFWRQMEPSGRVELVTAPAPTADERPAKTLPAKTEQIIQFPIFPTEARPVVNDLASSALFAAIQGKDRQLLNDVTIATTSDEQIIFSGEQFNQDDHDVFMQLVSVASSRPPGEYVTATAHSLLKALGRGMSGKEHKQLEAEIERLVKGTVKVKSPRFTYIGHLIDDAVKDEKTGYWVFRLNETLLLLYNADCYTLIGWQDRLQLKGKELARWLQLWIARYAAPYPVKVAWLWEQSGSKTKELREFRRLLQKALDHLQAAGYVKTWRIDEKDLVHIDRGDAISDSQRRKLTPPPRRGRGQRREK